MSGSRGALDALDADGWLLAVVTGKIRRGLHDVLEAHGLLSRFVTLKSADDGPGKPDPTLLLDAARESGCDPGRPVMVGDTVFDRGMAQRERVAGIAVTRGYHAVADRKDAVKGSSVDIRVVIGGRRNH